MNQLWNFILLAGVGWVIWLVLSVIRLLIFAPPAAISHASASIEEDDEDGPCWRRSREVWRSHEHPWR